jgi:hypothetical protein
VGGASPLFPYAGDRTQGLNVVGKLSTTEQHPWSFIENIFVPLEFFFIFFCEGCC